jgi:hypothetical protein
VPTRGVIAQQSPIVRPNVGQIQLNQTQPMYPNYGFANSNTGNVGYPGAATFPQGETVTYGQPQGRQPFMMIDPKIGTQTVSSFGNNNVPPLANTQPNNYFRLKES